MPVGQCLARTHARIDEHLKNIVHLAAHRMGGGGIKSYGRIITNFRAYVGDVERILEGLWLRLAVTLQSGGSMRSTECLLVLLCNYTTAIPSYHRMQRNKIKR